MRGINSTKFYTYHNRLIFDSKVQNIPDTITTTEITNALENAPIGIKEDKEPIGFFFHVSHRNATLYYGDIVITNKAYANHLNIEEQVTTMKDGKIYKIISYIKSGINEK